MYACSLQHYLGVWNIPTVLYLWTMCWIDSEWVWLNTSICEINSKSTLIRFVDNIKFLCLGTHCPAHSAANGITIISSPINQHKPAQHPCWSTCSQHGLLLARHLFPQMSRNITNKGEIQNLTVRSNFSVVGNCLKSQPFFTFFANFAVTCVAIFFLSQQTLKILERKKLWSCLFALSDCDILLVATVGFFQVLFVEYYKCRSFACVLF